MPSYLDNILAKREALEKGFDEALLLNLKGYVADTSLANIFMVKNERIFTPSINDGALPGAMRAILLKNFTLFPIEETSLLPQDLFQADEVFLTNALMGVKSIRTFEHHTFNKFSVAEKISAFLKN